MIYAVKVIIICAVCSLAERALPFVLFHGKEIPKRITYLGKVLPMAIITSLVFYCLRNVNLNNVELFLPQITAYLITVILHLWKKNAFLSIFGGTAVCMVLTHLI